MLQFCKNTTDSSSVSLTVAYFLGDGGAKSRGGPLIEEGRLFEEIRYLLEANLLYLGIITL